MKSLTLSDKKVIEVPCPRCSQPLADPDGLGWCKACGYCKTLEEDKAKVVLPQTPPPPNQAQKIVEATKVVGNVPVWVWCFLIGTGVLVAASLIPGRKLTLTPFQRALWTTAQMGGGLFLILVAQFIALLRIAPEDEKISFKDLFLPFRLWGLVFKRLPKLGFLVCLAGWGLAIFVSAIVFIGGLGHWMTYLPGGKNAPQNTKKIR